MSWSAKVLQQLNASKKIKQVAIYDLEGQLLSRTKDFIQLTHKELYTLYRCFPKTSPHPLSSVNIDGKTYRLLQVRKNTLIAIHDSELIVVYLSDHGLILAEGSATDPGSCIHEVLKAWREIELLQGLIY